MLLTVVLWIRNPFGFSIVLAWGAVLFAIAQRGPGRIAQLLLSLLAIQVALNAVYDIRALFFVGNAPSDAQTMARLFLLPAWTWASVWMVASGALFVWTLGIARGTPRRAR